MPTSETRCGFVCVLGPPNAGKSKLFNALVGEKLSAVTPKPQTSWMRLSGIRTDDADQMIFMDTPGLLAAESLHQRSMAAEAASGASDSDVALIVVDGSRRPSPSMIGMIQELLAGVAAPKAVVVNKSDLEGYRGALPWRAAAPGFDGFFETSARTGRGVAELRRAVRALLPEGPMLFPARQMTASSSRLLVQELVREAIFEQYRQEVPYASAPIVEEYREERSLLYISCVIYVERPSQKGLIIGRGGADIRRLGTRARRKIQRLVGCAVYLDLWVRVAKKWRSRRRELRRFGYRVPPRRA